MAGELDAGRAVARLRTPARGPARLRTLPRNGDAGGETILEKSSFLDEPQVSPDGRWLAYVSDESGRSEVYVEPFRRPGERVRVSTDGGGQPKWRADGKELFYVAPSGRLMAVDVSVSAGRLEVALPVSLFGGLNADPIWDMYALTRDGQRFLVVVPVGRRRPADPRASRIWT